jgi:hypothetical protein
MAAALDTLAQAKRLREAGFNETQAEVLTAALRDAAAPFNVTTLATKADLDALKAATKADLEALKATTKADLAALKVDLLVATKADLAAGLAGLKADLLQWMIGLVVGAVVFNAFVVVGSLLGITKLLGH